MTPPINIDGSSVSGITIDGTSVSEVTVDGQTVFGGIPDTSMFNDPIYQFYAGLLNASDGDSPVDFPEGLAGLADATANGSPTFREDIGAQNYPAIEYQQADPDTHDWTSDSQLPAGSSGQVSVAALILTNDGSSVKYVTGYGGGTGDAINLLVDGTNLKFQSSAGTDTEATNAVTTGSLQTIGWTLDFSNDNVTVYANGSSVATGSSTASPSDDNHIIGDGSQNPNQEFQGNIIEIVWSATEEPSQAYQDYHNDRV